MLEAFAVQTGLVLEYRRLRSREERAAALEGAEATSTALLRAVSHDLRTPLATMRAAVDGLVADGLADADRAALVGAVGEATDQLERLIDNLLDLSRVQSGLVKPALRPAQPRRGAADRGVRLPARGRLARGRRDRAVRADRQRTARAGRGQPGRQRRPGLDGKPVRVLGHVLPDTVEILVVDQGPGVPPEQRERMFEPFQRLDDVSPGGLGLGLAVARGLAEAVDAELSAEDTPGGGLTMVLSVPRAEVG